MNWSHTEIIDYTLGGQAVCSICYLISALFLSGNSYAGFNALLTGFLYAGSAGLTYYGLKQVLSRTIFGIILGVAVMLIFISLETAIFWGQYSGCTPAPPSGSSSSHHYGVECDHTGAMSSACFFSVMMLLSYLLLIGTLIKFKSEILGKVPLNERYVYVFTLVSYNESPLLSRSSLIPYPSVTVDTHLWQASSSVLDRTTINERVDQNRRIHLPQISEYLKNIRYMVYIVYGICSIWYIQYMVYTVYGINSIYSEI